MSERFIQAAVLIAAIATISAWAKPKLSITSPADGALVNPGQTITVTVNTEAVYRQVMVVGEGNIGFSLAVTAPYRFSISIPKNITPGVYRLTAVGTPPTGDNDFSEPIDIDVERPDRPISLKLQPSQITLRAGQQIPLSVYGTYVDGSIVDLTKSTQTTFVSRSPGIIRVSADGLVTALAPGDTEIVIDKDFIVNASVQE